MTDKNNVISLPTRQRVAWLLLAVPAMIALFFYWKVTEYWYVWDDYLFFQTTSKFRDGDIAWTDLIESVLPNQNYFRPLVLLSFNLEGLLEEDTQRLSHFNNLLLFLLNTTLVALLFKLIFEQAELRYAWARAIIAASLYAVNPAMIESVAWISGRFDLMLTSLALMMLIADQAIKQSTIRAVVVGILFFAAALCKEMAIMLPVLMVLCQLVSRHRMLPWRGVVPNLIGSEWRTIASIGIFGMIYLLLRQTAFGELGGGNPAVASKFAQLAERLWLVSETSFFYLRQGLFPFLNLSPLHPLNDFLSGGAAAWGHGVAVVGLLAAILLAAIRYRIPAAFLAGAFILSLLPVLNIIPLSIGGNIGHDRFLALPSVFLCGAIASLLMLPNASLAMNRFALLLLLLWGGISALNVHLTLPLWHNGVALWSWAVAGSPNSEEASSNLIGEAMHYNQFDIAGREFERLMKRSGGRLSGFPLVYYGDFLTRRGNPKAGEEILLQGIATVEARIFGEDVRPSFPAKKISGLSTMMPYAYVALAEAEMAQSRYAEARSQAKMALNYQPDYPVAQLMVAKMQFALGQLDVAPQLYEEALHRLLPGSRVQADANFRKFVETQCSKGDPSFSIVTCRYFGHEATVGISIEVPESSWRQG